MASKARYVKDWGHNGCARSFIRVCTSTTAPVTALKALRLTVSKKPKRKQQARAVQKHKCLSALMPAEWSQSSVLEQERHPYLALLPASLKITASPGRQRGQHTSQSASSSLKLSLLYRFVFLRGGWGAPFIWNGFYFIAMMTPSPSSKWKNRNRSVKRITSLFRTHPMSPSLGTAAEGLFPKRLFLDSSLHSSSFDFVYWKKPQKNPTAAASLFVFFTFSCFCSVWNMFPFLVLLWLVLKKKNKLINLGTFLPLMQTGILWWTRENTKENPQVCAG